MNKFILLNVVCFLLIGDVNSQTTGWTSWAECSEFLGCFRRRILNCTAGEGLECSNEADGAFEQRALDCSASLECLKNVTEMFQASEVCTLCAVCNRFFRYYIDPLAR